MLKLEISHIWRRKEDGTVDYISQMVEFDYSNLNEEKRDIVVNHWEYEGEPRETKRTYVTFARGLVVDYVSHYIGDGDSVGAFVVWDPILKQPIEFGVGYENGVYSDGTRLGPNQFAQTDATVEVKAEYQAYKDALEQKAAQARRDAEIARRKWEDEREAATPKAGRRVVVVKGRKVAKGTSGRVFWYGQTQFGYRVGIILADNSKVFTSADNVEVVDNLKYLERMSELSELGGSK